MQNLCSFVADHDLLILFNHDLVHFNFTHILYGYFTGIGAISASEITQEEYRWIDHTDGLMQKRCNSSALAVFLALTHRNGPIKNSMIQILSSQVTRRIDKMQHINLYLRS